MMMYIVRQNMPELLLVCCRNSGSVAEIDTFIDGETIDLPKQ